jgi:hypothetical protein
MEKNFLFSKQSVPTLGHTQPTTQLVFGFFIGVKAAGA